MLVKERMSRNVFTISKDEKVNKAIDIMNSHKFHRLPVVDNNQLVGLISEGMINTKGATKATSLSIFELNYLMSKTTVETLMEKNVHTIQEDQLIEDAALKMLQYNIGCLPVLNSQSKLVGILTQNDLFKSFIDLLGYHDAGSRFCLEVEDGIGVLENITSIISKEGASISHIAAYDGENAKTNIVVRIDRIDIDKVQSKLEQAGYKILSVTQNKA